MKTKFLSIVCVVAGAVVLCTSVASAQFAGRALGFGVYAGGSFPLGDFKSEANTGYHGGLFGMLPLTQQLSVRADGSYTSFGSKNLVFTDVNVTEKTTLLIGTLDLHYNLGTVDEMAPNGGALPYISAGAGEYRFSFDDKCGASGCGSVTFGDAHQNHWGLNAGAGAFLPFSGFTPFVDIRYHNVFWGDSQIPDAHFVLISLGLKF